MPLAVHGAHSARKPSLPTPQHKFYPSSKLCCICKKNKHDLQLKDRIYKCDCGNIIDRDFQATINLYNYGLAYVS
ncbi:MAG: transposase [Desulfovibrio sp.]|nr:transposase [Desulfovibrio sp.]